MIDIVGKPFDINIYHIVQMLFLHFKVGGRDGMFTSPIGAEAKAVGMKFCLTDGFQDLKDTLLYKSICNGRNAQGTGFPIRFWDFYSSYTLWLVPVELALYVPYQALGTPCIQTANGSAICSGCFAACVFPDIPICHFDIVFRAYQRKQVCKYRS